jgi:hypothetical protein
LLSELDASYGNVGGRISAAAWYDAVYNRGNQNSSATSNHTPGNEILRRDAQGHGPQGRAA